jgi:5-methylcytosine-specific restriction endonuclease McrA
MGSTIRHPYQLGAILHQRTGIFHVVHRVDCSAEYGMSVATLAYLERYGVCATCHRSMTPIDAHEACFGPSRGWVGNLTASTAVLLVQTDSQDARNLQRLRSMDQPLAAAMRRRRNIEAAGGELHEEDVHALCVAQGSRCYYCFDPFPVTGSRRFQRDHLVPVVHGGSWNIQNIVLACSRCNGLKGDQNVERFVKLQLSSLNPETQRNLRQMHADVRKWKRARGA